MMTSFDHALDSRPYRIFNGVRPESQQNSNNHDNGLTETDQEVPLMVAPLQHGNSIQKLTFGVRIHGEQFHFTQGPT